MAPSHEPTSAGHRQLSEPNLLKKWLPISGFSPEGSLKVLEAQWAIEMSSQARVSANETKLTWVDVSSRRSNKSVQAVMGIWVMGRWSLRCVACDDSNRFHNEEKWLSLTRFHKEVIWRMCQKQQPVHQQCCSQIKTMKRANMETTWDDSSGMAGMNINHSDVLFWNVSMWLFFL